jgi:L-rhamnose mutarotase
MPKENMGRSGKYKYILTVMDCFTRYAWAVPLRDKTGSTTKDALENIIKLSKRKPEKLWTDRGKEFYAKTMLSFLNQHNIEIYSTNNEAKAFMIERFNRTIEEKLWKIFSIQGNQKWVKILPDVINNYNNKKHSTIRLSPKEASDHPEKVAAINSLNSYKNEDQDFQSEKKKYPKFKVGDRVIVYKYKHKFEKGYTEKWTREVFVVSKVIPSSPFTYRVKDLKGEEIEGRWYQSQLQKTRF